MSVDKRNQMYRVNDEEEESDSEEADEEDEETDEEIFDEQEELLDSKMMEQISKLTMWKKAKLIVHHWFHIIASRSRSVFTPHGRFLCPW
jgi:hypothetical protein